MVDEVDEVAVVAAEEGSCLVFGWSSCSCLQRTTAIMLLSPVEQN